MITPACFAASRRPEQSGPASVFRFLVVAAASCWLAACATSEPAGRSATPNRIVDTPDLADVTDSALDFARTAGADAVLVVFDIDNTLLAMEQDLGSDQWWDWQRSLRDEAPCAPERVADPLAVQGALYFASAMRLTQQDAPEQLRRLHDAGLRTLALTSRGPGFRLQTFRELRRHGLDFGSHTIGPPGGYPDDFVPASGSRPSRFEDGVFLTAGQHKGDMLRDLLRRTGTPDPSFIVMADDKRHNLQDVLDAFAGTRVSVQAWRYAREDETLERFDADQAAAQWAEVAPALRALQKAFGEDNFALPESDRPAGCEPVGR